MVAQADTPDLRGLRQDIGNRTNSTDSALDDEDGSPPPVADPVMFRGVLGECVTTMDPYTEADSIGVLVSLMSAVGAIIGPTPHLMIGPTRHPLLIWPLLFGRSGTGRKGEAASAASVLINSAEPDASKFTITPSPVYPAAKG
ncbi:MAG: hypothetical protein M3460_25205 [Actinomycetota bacterium]|nr:hypothetical protein [Actinomycetota bacterium]